MTHILVFPNHVHTIHTHAHVQLCVYVMYKEVDLANKLMDFINGFNITVRTIKEILPSVSYKVDNFFYDAQSFAEAYLSKYTCSVSVQLYMCS